MDPGLRNRGWLKLGIGALFFVVAVGLLALVGDFQTRHQFSDRQNAVAVLIYLITVMFGIWGSLDLAKAKGYGSEIVTVILVVGFCCAPAQIYGLPVGVIFGLDDKNRRRRHRHR